MVERFKRAASVAALVVLSVTRRFTRRRISADGGNVALRRRPWTVRSAVLTAVMVLLTVGLDQRLRGLLVSGTTLPPAITEVRGFSGDVGTPPDHGAWRGIGTVISSTGYSDSARGQEIVRFLLVGRICENQRSCHFEITRQLMGEAPESAPLVRESDGWRASFPIRKYSCGQSKDGSWIYWPQHTTMVFRFAPRGGTLEARERDYSWASGCGYGTSETAWTGVSDIAPRPGEMLGRSPTM
jgi:hypothetical protein